MKLSKKQKKDFQKKLDIELIDITNPNVWINWASSFENQNHSTKRRKKINMNLLQKIKHWEKYERKDNE